jgi:hypothetical protein
MVAMVRDVCLLGFILELKLELELKLKPGLVNRELAL